MYKFIVNPNTNRKVSIFNKKGNQILNEYIKISQYGGHEEECSLKLIKNGIYEGTKRCRKSGKTGDKFCENVNGRCRQIKKSKTKKQSIDTVIENPNLLTAADESTPKTIMTAYLQELLDDFTVEDEEAPLLFFQVDDEMKQLEFNHSPPTLGEYGINKKGYYKYEGAIIPFKYISSVIPVKMESDYGEEGRNLGKQSSDWDEPGKIVATDSANWYKDSLDLNIGDIVIDESYTGDFPVVSIPFLVYEHNGEKSLVSFIFVSEEDDDEDDLDFDDRFDNRYINDKGRAKHPITKDFVKIR